MLKKLVNEARFRLRLEATGPLLVKSGHASISGPDMTPVRTFRNGRAEVYVPGSSLKGIMRSHLEKIGRTLHDGVVCDPFAKTGNKAQVQGNRLVCPEYVTVSCSDKFEVRQKKELRVRVGNHEQDWQHTNLETLTNEQVYADSCPICRLFGSTSYIGRVSIGDAYLTADSPGLTELRDGVGIDRLTGGAAKHAKFELEVVSAGTTFETEIYLRNFETWQLGMLMLVTQDLADEFIRVGSGRSRGLGAVKGTIDEVTISHLGHVNGKPANQVWGLGKFLLGDAQYDRYGTWLDDLLTIEPAPSEIRQGVRLVAAFSGGSLANLQQHSIDAFIQRLQGWQLPITMSFAHLEFARKDRHG